MKRGGGRNLSSNKGFTLAEVLVTLGIIGVVSAMTVPTLMQNYQRKSYVTQLHKVYNELSQAALQYITDRNAVDLKEAGLIVTNNNTTAFENFIKNYFKVVQDCDDSPTPCFAPSYKKISGITINPLCTKNCMVISSGASLGFAQSSNNVIEITVDVNGQKGPNVFGRDFFVIFLYPNGIIDDLAVKDIDDSESHSWSTNIAPLSTDVREANFNRSCIDNASEAHGCFGKILNDNWEMTY